LREATSGSSTSAGELAGWRFANASPESRLAADHLAALDVEIGEFSADELKRPLV
jgi:hypothetical protein